MFDPIAGRHSFTVVSNTAGETVISAAIGKSRTDGRIVYLTCGLAACVEMDVPVSEFYFQIDVADLDDTFEPFSTQDRELARPYIPDSIRAKVVELIGAGLDFLLDRDNPDGLFFVTKTAGLPAKALVKFEVVRQTAESKGYFTSVQGADLLGRRYWMLAKMSN